MAEADDDPTLHVDFSESCLFYAPELHSEKSSLPARRLQRGWAEKAKDEVLETELPKLLNGKEGLTFVTARADAFRHLWSRKRVQLDKALEEANLDTTESISAFVLSARDLGSPRELPAGLINAGLASSASGSMYDAIARSVSRSNHHIIFHVHAVECHNLKAALKTIVHRGTAQTYTDSDDELLGFREGRGLLSYDLQALYNQVQGREIQRCIVYFQNSEALDPQVLAELVDVLLSWQDRIPFILLFEMAISTDLFQEKLSRSTVRKLNGAVFESKPASEILDILFSAATKVVEQPAIMLGSAVSRMLLDRQTEHIASAKGFVSSIKYCYMVHFYQNPLSFLCEYDGACNTLQPEHLDHLLNLPSFKRYLNILSGDGDSGEARKLTDDMRYFRSKLRSMLQKSRLALRNIQDALEILMVINEFTAFRSTLTYSTLYTKALAGDLVDSSIIRELLLSIRKLSSDKMLELLLCLRESSILAPVELEADIKILQSNKLDFQAPVLSSYNIGSELIRTTIKGQKVVLDKESQKQELHVAEYTKLVDRVDMILLSCMAKRLIAPRDICFHEVFLFDGKTTLRTAFSATPRASLERAMSRPHDYLACACCDVLEGQLASTQPATALLYQLYLESGATINIQDLWLAFRAIAGTERETAEDQEDEKLALFHRALAELRYLGMLKNNKRKADHLARIQWKGL